jgi:hypothetical protein
MRLFKTMSATLLALTLSGSAFAAPPTNPAHPLGPTPVVITVDAATRDLRTAFGPDLAITWAPGTADTTPTPKHLRRLAVPTVGAAPVDRATHFLTTHRDRLGLGHLAFRPLDTKPLPSAMGHVVRFELSTIENLEIQDMSLTVRIDKDGLVRSFTSDALPFALPTTTATLSPDAAITRVRDHFAIASNGAPSLVALVLAPHQARLAYRIPVAVIPLQAHFDVWVDATTGAILHESPTGFDQRMTRLPTRTAELPK